MRILVVDDEPAIVHYLETVLLSAGHEVWASILNTEEGAEDVTSVASLMRFDAALIDLLMPAVTGDILAQRLREIAPSMKLVLLTRDSMGQLFRDRGIVDQFLLEPFEYEDLMRTLHPV